MGSEKRELVFKNHLTGEEARRVDVTGISDQSVARIQRGMLINIAHDWYVDDVVTPAGRSALSTATKGEGHE